MNAASFPFPGQGGVPSMLEHASAFFSFQRDEPSAPPGPGT